MFTVPPKIQRCSLRMHWTGRRAPGRDVRVVSMLPRKAPGGVQAAHRVRPGLPCRAQTCPGLTCPGLTCPGLTCPGLTCPVGSVEPRPALAYPALASHVLLQPALPLPTLQLLCHSLPYPVYPVPPSPSPASTARTAAALWRTTTRRQPLPSPCSSSPWGSSAAAHSGPAQS
jgi:hypothetical protein